MLHLRQSRVGGSGLEESKCRRRLLACGGRSRLGEICWLGSGLRAELGDMRRKPGGGMVWREISEELIAMVVIDVSVMAVDYSNYRRLSLVIRNLVMKGLPYSSLERRICDEIVNAEVPLQ